MKIDITGAFLLTTVATTVSIASGTDASPVRCSGYSRHLCSFVAAKLVPVMVICPSNGAEGLTSLVVPYRILPIKWDFCKFQNRSGKRMENVQTDYPRRTKQNQNGVADKYSPKNLLVLSGEFCKFSISCISASS